MAAFQHNLHGAASGTRSAAVPGRAFRGFCSSGDGEMRVHKRFQILRRRALFVGGATAVLVIAMASPGRANLAGSSFEGNDGNLVVNTAGGTDWINAPNRVRGDDQPSGTN